MARASSTNLLLRAIAVTCCLCQCLQPVFSSTGEVCNRTLSEALQFRSAAELSAPVNVVNGSLLHDLLNATWGVSSPLQATTRYLLLTAANLDIDANASRLNCSRGGRVFLDCASRLGQPCVVRGLDVVLSNSSCALIVRGVRLEQCGGDGPGECIAVSNCPFLAFISSQVSLVGYSQAQPSNSDSTVLFQSSSILCSHCSAFPLFGANRITGDASQLSCQSPGNCSVALTTSIVIANSSQLVIQGFDFQACPTPSPPTHSRSPGHACFSLSSSTTVLFNSSQFSVAPGALPLFAADNRSRLSFADTQFVFESSSEGSEGNAALAWPVPDSSALSSVQFLCRSSSDLCEIHDPHIRLTSAADVLLQGLDFRECHSAHCLLVAQSRNLSLEHCTFSAASFPFLWTVDTQWNIRNTSFANLTTSTFAPSQVRRFWFPDFYQHNSYSGAITSTYTTSRDVICTLSDVVFYNLTACNDTLTRSWGLGGAVFVLFTGNTTRSQIHFQRVMLDSINSGGMGGGVFVAFDEYATGNLVFIVNSSFTNCSSGVRAGAMHTVHNGDSANNSVTLHDVLFRSCGSHIAAGAFNVFYRQNITRVYPPHQRNFTGQVHLLRCRFLENHVVLDATSIQAWSFLPFGQSSLPMIIEDCIFHDNHARMGQGAVVTYEAPITLRGFNEFINNSNTAIFLTHTSMLVEGDILFLNNTGVDYGGGIGLIENCFIYLAPEATLQFTGNRACKGPAVYVNPGVQQGVGAVGDRHSVCSLTLATHLNYTRLLSGGYTATSLANISFSTSSPNTCPVDASRVCDQRVCTEDVYITSLSDCIDSSKGEFSNYSRQGFSYAALPVLDKIFLNLVGLRKNATLRISTDASALILNETLRLAGYPGQEISLDGLQVTDQANVRTVASVYITVVDPKIRQFVSVMPELVLVQREGHQSPRFTVRIAPHHYRSMLNATSMSAIIHLHFTLVHSSFTVSRNASLHLQRCPPGFDISPAEAETEAERVCSYVGSDGIEGSKVLTHDLQTGRIYLHTGYWGYYDKASNRIYTWVCPLFYCHCHFDATGRFPGCMFSPRNADAQCNIYRAGHLCGNCRGSYTTRLFGTACRSCSDTHKVIGWLVLLVFILGTTAACGLVLYYNIGIPPELLGVLFFLQTCYYAAEPGSPITTNWINARPSNDSFAEVIFNPCVGYDWQPLYSVVMNYSLVLIGAAVILMVYLLTRCGLFQILATRSSLNGVWLIFLLTYTTSTDTVLKSLRCVVANPDGQRRYYYNGNRFCFNFGGSNDSGWLGWGILSMLIFLGMLLPTPFLMFFLSRGYFKRMKQFRDIIESSYVESRRWWAGVDLLRRMLLAIIYYIAATSRIRQVSVAVISFLLLLLHCLAMPYKKTWVNWGEAVVLFDFFILAVLGLDGRLDQDVSKQGSRQAPGYIFLTLPLLYGLLLLVRRFYLRLRRQWPSDAGGGSVGNGDPITMAAALTDRPPRPILSGSLFAASESLRLETTDSTARHAGGGGGRHGDGGGGGGCRRDEATAEGTEADGEAGDSADAGQVHASNAVTTSTAPSHPLLAR